MYRIMPFAKPFLKYEILRVIWTFFSYFLVKNDILAAESPSKLGMATGKLGPQQFRPRGI